MPAKTCPNHPFGADHRYHATGGTVADAASGKREVTVIRRCKWCGETVTTFHTQPSRGL